jgi:hypothetical protein
MGTSNHCRISTDLCIQQSGNDVITWICEFARYDLYRAYDIHGMRHHPWNIVEVNNITRQTRSWHK